MVSFQETLSQIILEKIEFIPCNILDIGCGNGVYLNILCSETGASGTGIDINEKYIAEGKKELSNPKISLEVMDGCNLVDSITQESYDLILAIGSRVLDLGIYDADQIQRNLETYYNLLSENGSLVIFENTDFTGNVEPCAGWQYKTVKQISLLQLPNSRTFYYKFRYGKLLFPLPLPFLKIIHFIRKFSFGRIHPTCSYLIVINSEK